MRSAAFAAAALVVLVLPLAACGSADLSSVAEAADQTQDARSARIHLDFELLDKPQRGFPETGTLEGVADFDARRLRLVFESDGRFVGETIQDGAVTYFRLPKGEQFVEGKPWLKLDPEHVPPSSEGFTAEDVADVSFRMYDPGLWLDVLRDGERFEEVDRATVRGVSTTRYSGTISVEDFLAALLEGRRDTFPELTPETREAEMRIDVWVGEDDLIRRIEQLTPRIAYTTSEPLVIPPQRSTIEFFDFGAAVDIELPPEEDVFELGVPD